MFMPRWPRALTGGAVTLGLCTLMVVTAASPALAGRVSISKFTPGRAMYDAGVPNTLTALDAANVAAASTKLKTFSAPVTDTGTTYKYVISGSGQIRE